MLRFSVAAISALLISSLLWAQTDTSKPSADKSVPAPSSSAPLPDSTKVELVKGVHAAYPEAAREKQLQGQVWLKVHISENGDVEGVDVLSGEPYAHYIRSGQRFPHVRHWLALARLAGISRRP